MNSWLHDLRYAWRALLNKPAFTAAVVITMALGIGVNTAIFSVISGVLFKPLPFERPNELVEIESSGEYSQWQVYVTGAAYQNFVDWRAQNEAFDGLGAYRTTQHRLLGEAVPERLAGAEVTGDFFATLGVNAQLGRVFAIADEEPEAPKSVILSHGFWRRRFGSDADVVGRNLILDQDSYTIVGVMPADFHYPLNITEAEAFTVVKADAKEHSSRSARRFSAIGRLKPGVDLQAAQTQMDALAARLEQQYPKANEQYALKLQGLHEVIAGDARSGLLLLQGAAGIVLLIMCANCANLFLARNAGRVRELSVRTALGAGRLRLIRHLLTESLLIGLMGGVLGAASAYWSTDLLVALAPAELPLKETIAVDGFVLAIALLASVLTGLAAGLPSALRAARQATYVNLKESPQAGASGSRQRLQGAFVVAQTALALMLLIGAGLFLRSFESVMNVKLGFDPENVLCFCINMNEAEEAAQRSQTLYELQERLGALPGVDSVTACRAAPLCEGTMAGVLHFMDDKPREPSYALLNPVAENYFKSMHVPLLHGRGFSEHDALGARGVAIIDEGMAGKYWPDEDPIGQRITLGYQETDETPADYEIVGIVADVRTLGLEDEELPMVYVPYRQHPHRDMSVALRTSGKPTDLIPTIRRVTAGLIHQDAPYAFTTLREAIAATTADRRYPMQLLGVFSGLALILATLGVYGMLSYAVAQRTHEIGVRMALGAQRGTVMMMTFRKGALLTGAGIALGAGGALASTRLLENRLFGVSPSDTTTFVVVSLLLASTAAAACYFPARRATKIDPMVALRCE